MGRYIDLVSIILVTDNIMKFINKNPYHFHRKGATGFQRLSGTSPTRNEILGSVKKIDGKCNLGVRFI